MRPSPSLSVVSVQLRPPISGSTGWQFKSAEQASSSQSVRPSWSLSTVSKQSAPSSVTGTSAQSGPPEQSKSKQSTAPSPSSSKPLSQASTIEITPPSVPSAVVSTPPPSGSRPASDEPPPSDEPSKTSPSPPEPLLPESLVPPPRESLGAAEVPQAARRRSRNGAASVLADMGPQAKGASKEFGAASYATTPRFTISFRPCRCTLCIGFAPSTAQRVNARHSETLDESPQLLTIRRLLCEVSHAKPSLFCAPLGRFSPPHRPCGVQRREQAGCPRSYPHPSRRPAPSPHRDPVSVVVGSRLRP